MCGVMNRTARFVPGCVVAATVSSAMARVCKFGVVLRKSGLNASRLTNQSLGFACVISEPESEIRLKSSRESEGCDSTHRRSASTIFVKRGMAFASRTASDGPGLIATTSWTEASASVSALTGRDSPSSERVRSPGFSPVTNLPFSSYTSSRALT